MADRATEKAPVVERTGVHGTYPGPLQKLPDYADEVITKVEHDLVITGNDLAKVQEAAKELGLEETRQVLRDVVQIHENDQNFPIQVLQSMKDFLANDNILDNPDKYETLIAEMRVEAALIKDDSAYPEVRAVVDNTDDPTLPCSTIRAWTIGIIYVSAGVLINQLFYIRQPSITLESNVAQLLAYPAGKAWEAWVPSREFKLFGQTHNLNPGKFNKKEHMLITIMANVGFTTPYTTDIIFVPVSPAIFQPEIRFPVLLSNSDYSWHQLHWVWDRGLDTPVLGVPSALCLACESCHNRAEPVVPHGIGSPGTRTLQEHLQYH
ncbi:hypothetical protein PMIN02_002273 [Paraphaeosphaeria minitans]